MAVVKFYEKPGCVNNTKQKRILELAGHSVEAIDIIKYKWTESELLSFLSGVNFEKWFNLNAPTIMSGEDKPTNYTEQSAIKAMLKNPLLIKRPLIEVYNIKIVGFDKTNLDKLIGLNSDKQEMNQLMGQNLEICPQKLKNTTCD